MNKILLIVKKFLAATLAASLIVAYSVPVSVLAQEVTPDPTPTPTQTEVTNDITANNNVDTNANTGDNTIGEPTPTPSPAEAQTEEGTPTPSPTGEPTPTDTPTPTPTPEEAAQGETLPHPETQDSLTATNSAEVVNEATSSADSGNNAISSSESSESSTDSTGETAGNSESAENSETGNDINTGDAVAVTTVENGINSTAINSEVIFQTINIFVDQEGDIDLSNPQALIEGLIRAFPDQAEINVALTQITNTATLTNTVNSTANTGNNEIYGGEEGSIETGDAYSLVSLLNRVNFVMIDSKLHVVTINIFGNLVGNIILPDIDSSGESAPCEKCNPVNLDNQATVHNMVDSQAVSGQNEIVNAEQAEISTGGAVSVVQMTNLVNINFINGSIWQLWIIPLGFWEGSFLGWGSFGSEPAGRLNLVYTDNGASELPCDGCVGELTVGNSAQVTNSVNSTANSGTNLIQNAENAAISTGRATSVVSLFNFVNSNFIRSRGFFGFINIFGRWTGNIGGASFFAVEEVPEEQPPETTSEETTQTPPAQNSEDSPRETGGQLAISLSHNVGEYVLPGDTVTFFITVKNPGTGKVYEAIVDLRLVKDGEDRGGARFNLGTIEPGKGAKITTGLVLSETTPPGEYIAVATVRGVVGPDNAGISTSAESPFRVFGVLATGGETADQPAPEVPRVLGATDIPSPLSPNILLALAVLFLLIPQYLILRYFKERPWLRLLLARNVSLQLRTYALRMFLF